MPVQSLSEEDRPEKGMAAHSSITAGRNPWTEEPGALQSTGAHVRRDEHTRTRAVVRLSTLGKKAYRHPLVTPPKALFDVLYREMHKQCSPETNCKKF